MTLQRWLIWIYIILFLILTLYSYTQIDLNLTLSSNHYYQLIQRQLIQLGYYQRQISTGILALLLISLFGFYFWALKLAVEKRLTNVSVKWLIAVTGILIFAYPAFSHDLFNYMFDARVVTNYGLDPSFFKALDFPFDPWTRFMRWTHRYYPYGPGWLLLTLIPSVLGMGKFVVTLFFFKLMFLLFHLANIWLIGEIGEMWGKEKKIVAMMFYALNPLILIESLVSPHNETAMLTGVLLAVYFWSKKQAFRSAIFLIASIGIKYVSVVLTPIFLLTKKFDVSLIPWMFFLWLAALIPVVLQREPYSWYLVPLVAFAALSSSKLIKVATAAASAALLSRYLPFFLYGDYGVTTQNLQWWFLWGTLIVSTGIGWVWIKE